jgi:16S rRNA (adenine1518-N6/adenine1519-N6)-dimethyltransferase
LPHKNVFLPSLRETIEQHGLFAKKSLGQNFLLNMEITRRIAKAAGKFNDCIVLEIGPGPGGLTRALLEEGAHVVAIERDERCKSILNELQSVYPEFLKVIDGDALKISPQVAIPQENIKIVANLPYNIGTVLLIDWLSDLDRIQSMTLMFQKEVALRLTASPRSKAYGRLSVLTQWLCEPKRLFDLSPSAFLPPPKVTSTVVHLIPKAVTADEKALFPMMEKITQHAFGQRRKMIRSSLKPLFADYELINLGLNPNVRAEELSVKDYILLAKDLSARSLKQ